MYVLSMYLFILFFFFLSPALQDFEECPASVPQRDENMPVPDAQQPPADLDIDRDDLCPEDEEFFDRPDA